MTLDHTEHRGVPVGGLSRHELLDELRSGGILLNEHAETLLENAVFDKRAARTVTVTERTVASLGLVQGANLSRILEVAQELGLSLCPPDTGPYLRLALSAQATAPDSVLSAGRAPAGSLTVATMPLSDDDDYPKGFYLRVVEGQAWLRGYRCDDAHMWAPDDRFVFASPSAPTPR